MSKNPNSTALCSLCKKHPKDTGKMCLVCKTRQRKYYKNNPDRVRRNNKRSRERKKQLNDQFGICITCPQKAVKDQRLCTTCKEKKKKYVDPEKRKKYRERYYDEHRDKIREHSRRYYREVLGPLERLERRRARQRFNEMTPEQILERVGFYKKRKAKNENKKEKGIRPK